jgi:hypothetical protein
MFSVIFYETLLIHLIILFYFLLTINKISLTSPFHALINARCFIYISIAPIFFSPSNPLIKDSFLSEGNLKD